MFHEQWQMEIDIRSDALVDKLFDEAVMLVDCLVDFVELFQLDDLKFIFGLLVGADEGITFMEGLGIFVILISEGGLISHYLLPKLFVQLLVVDRLADEGTDLFHLALDFFLFVDVQSLVIEFFASERQFQEFFHFLDRLVIVLSHSAPILGLFTIHYFVLLDLGLIGVVVDAVYIELLVDDLRSEPACSHVYEIIEVQLVLAEGFEVVGHFSLGLLVDVYS